MTWYKVGLWPGKGYMLDVVLVEADSEYSALAKAAAMGYGDTMDSSQYEMYLNSIGVPPEKEAEYEDEDYSWFDDEGFCGYLNLRHAYAIEASRAEEKIGEIGCQLYFFGPTGKYVVDSKGNEVGVCGNCGKVTLEMPDGSCPFCHAYEMRSLNIAYNDDEDLLFKYTPPRGASMDRKLSLKKGQSKPLIDLKKIKLRRK